MSHACREVFRLRYIRGGSIDLAACWDQIDVPGIAARLREVAAVLEAAPPGTTGEGKPPLFVHLPRPPS